MKQNKVTHGWIRFIKKTGEYIDVPFPRGQGGHERKSMFDLAYMWTHNAFTSGEKDVYDYYSIYSLDENGEFRNGELPVMLLYVPAWEEKISQEEELGKWEWGRFLVEIDDVVHFPVACTVDLETNEIIPPEGLLEKLGVGNIMDLVRYNTLFP